MMTIPPLLKILIVFAGILAIGRLRVPLWCALIFGGLAVNRRGGNSLPDVLVFLF